MSLWLTSAFGTTWLLIMQLSCLMDYRQHQPKRLLYDNPIFFFPLNLCCISHRNNNTCWWKRESWQMKSSTLLYRAECNFLQIRVSDMCRWLPFLSSRENSFSYPSGNWMALTRVVHDQNNRKSIFFLSGKLMDRLMIIMTQKRKYYVESCSKVSFGALLVTS